ncbi:MAG: alcohol dehydrogenase family protein [Spirochaetaceae bacterium]|nr:alcohol dehydrogenase family protein [Spirochaetaceae bacterium]
MDMMRAVVTTGTGGLDKLEYKSVPVPVPEKGEVLIRVLAAGVNNTEINTRLGWYSSSITDGTEAASGTADSRDAVTDGGWNAVTPFPFIQGTDCCGRVASLGPGGDESLVGRRVLIRPCLGDVWMGSDFDGAFAQYVKVPSSEVFPLDSDWSDAELATLPCAYGTAENMLERANLKSGETVLVVGATGGVGSAAVQLAKRRGAEVIAITSAAKTEAVKAVGADRVVERGKNLIDSIGEESVDLAVDNVAGEGFPGVLAAIKRGGRYVTSGAIGGPIVQLDMRQMYLKDITLIGCTAWDEPVFGHLVKYIERDEIRPLLAGIFPLRDIAKVQEMFLKKQHVGKFVLIPE